MYRFTLFVFGVSIAFSGMCTMTYAAEMHDASMSNGMVCEAAAEHGAIGVCDGAMATLSSPMPCADGSCFIRSVTRDSDTFSSSKLSTLFAASLPTTLGELMRTDQLIRPLVFRGGDRPPPDILSSVMLRV